jgi:uncharacterized protein (DUF1501 family)
MSRLHRRQFLSTLGAAAAILALKPSFAASSQKTLLVIELAGGNDGLNTFIPIADPNYTRLRSSLAIKQGIPVTSTVALHPSLKDWKGLIENGSMAIIQNVGYPNPDLSHFRSKEIWQSASTGSADSGWLARFLESQQAEAKDAVILGSEYPLALTGQRAHYLHLAPDLAIHTEGSLGQAIRNLYATPQEIVLAEQVRQTILESTQAIESLSQDLDRRIANQGYPQGGVGQQFALMARILESKPRILYATLGGWDTHTNQSQRHERLLTQLGQGLAALYRDLQSQGLDQSVLVMVQSEFGRRPAQNGSGGTDHGTAGPIILLGPITGGFYGGDPALDSLVQENLPIQVDFRSVYQEILRGWLSVDPEDIVPGSFPAVGILG